jgi:hypothetical protein
VKPLYDDEERVRPEPKSRFPRLAAARDRVMYFLMNNPIFFILLLPVIFAAFYVCYYLILYFVFHQGS